MAKIGKFKMNRSGYIALMNSAGVQGQLEKKANRIKSSANAKLSPDGYRLEGHEAKPIKGKMANGYLVRTKTNHARYSNAKNNTLLKSLRG